MGEHKFIFWLNVIVGTLVGGFLANWIAASVLAEYSWCIAGEEHCVREWVSALSGWVAAVGALAAAIFTLRPLREQVVEARRQSDFLIGDAAPEFVLQRNAYEKRILLVVTNWNRRRIMLDRIGVVHSPVGLQFFDLKDFDDDQPKSWREQVAQGDKPSFGIDGSFDRTRAAKRRRFSVLLAKDGKLAMDEASIRAALTIQLGYRIVGQAQMRHEASASAFEIE